MYPDMYRIRQRFEGPAVADIPATVQAELATRWRGIGDQAWADSGPDGWQPRCGEHRDDYQGDGGLSEDDRR